MMFNDSGNFPEDLLLANILNLSIAPLHLVTDNHRVFRQEAIRTKMRSVPVQLFNNLLDLTTRIISSREFDRLRKET